MTTSQLLANSQQELESEGYLVFESPAWQNQFSEIDFKAITDLIKVLKTKGWPPVFALMYDECWVILRHIWQTVETLMDSPVVLDPSLFIWALSVRQSSGNEQSSQEVGNNFGLPHRDFSHHESFLKQINSSRSESMKILNCWIPITDATLVGSFL